MSSKNFKPTLLVLAPYPNKDNLNDGFIQRVNKMDEFMEGIKRVYIQVSLKSFTRKEKIYYGTDVVSYKINFLLHWYLLLGYCMRANLIYAHTIYNLVWLKYFFNFIKCPIILDVHGTVPEEIAMSGNSKRANEYNSIERNCFKNISTAIFVTESMSNHYLKKYPNFKFNSVKYGIIPDHIKKENLVVSSEKLHGLKKNLNISDNDVVVIYSGGLHIWQNIDEMLSLISEKKSDENVVYIFLVSDKEKMHEMINNYSLGDKRIILDSVHPSELKFYYSISHYGFVLRDDCVVNRVANPTKLIEYLYYGLTPIVKLEEIGDFKAFGYNFISREAYLNETLTSDKNQRNQNVVDYLFSSYSDSQIKELFKNI